MGSSLHAILPRIKTLFRKRRMDRDMAGELEFHQSMLRDKLAGQGVPTSELNDAARQTFGDAGRWHERLRELSGSFAGWRISSATLAFLQGC